LRLKRQPATQREALEWLDYFERHGIFVDLGLMQVSTAEAQHRGLSVESLLDPCFNLRAGLQILDSAYQLEVKTYGPARRRSSTPFLATTPATPSAALITAIWRGHCGAQAKPRDSFTAR